MADKPANEAPFRVINDRFPRATTEEGAPKADADWALLRTVVERGASLGSGAIILGGVRIGARAMVGAGAVVTRDVAPDTVVAGIPARERWNEVRRPATPAQ